MANQATMKCPTERRTTQWFGRRRTGWIGVDVGTCSIKVAQVAYDDGWRLLHSHIIPLENGQTIDEESLSRGLAGDALGTAVGRQSGFRGRRAACTLPLSVMDLCSFEFPPGTDEEISQMIEQELGSSADGNSVREFGFWQMPQMPQTPNGQSELTQASVLSVARRTAAGVASDLLRFGLECHVLDGLPFALARAVAMVPYDCPTAPQAAIDWGYTSPLFTLVVNGRPVFARRFRDQGLRHLMRPVCERLQLSHSECRQLLATYGFSGPSAAAQPGNVSQVLADLASGPFRTFTQEIQKTLSFLRQQHQHLFPERIWLFGGGATIRHAADWITSAVDIETAVWQLPSSPAGIEAHANPIQAVLGPAIALSALAGVP